MHKPEDMTPPATATPADELFVTALRRMRNRATAAASGAALVSGMGLGASALGACATDDMLALQQLEQESWSQDEGQRNTQMVAFTGDSWTECKAPNTRFGCGSYEVNVKVKIKPVAGVDLNWKKVGITYRTPYDTYDRTAVGRYFATLADGHEEWHVPVTVYSSWSTLVFDAWYQDGKGHTYTDDNQGEFHVVNTGAAQAIVRVEPWLSTVAITDAGVSGSISVQVADLDYDKELVLLATTDDWATVTEIPMGSAGEKNKLYWKEDTYGGFERWQADLDLPGDVQKLQYAVGYRHGVKNGAKTYEFWDNNYGYNYVVEKPVPTPEVE